MMIKLFPRIKWYVQKTTINNILFKKGKIKSKKIDLKGRNVSIYKKRLTLAAKL